MRKLCKRVNAMRMRVRGVDKPKTDSSWSSFRRTGRLKYRLGWCTIVVLRKLVTILPHRRGQLPVFSWLNSLPCRDDLGSNRAGPNHRLFPLSFARKQFFPTFRQPSAPAPINTSKGFLSAPSPEGRPHLSAQQADESIFAVFPIGFHQAQTPLTDSPASDTHRLSPTRFPSPPEPELLRLELFSSSPALRGSGFFRWYSIPIRPSIHFTIFTPTFL
ncbi:unnamed protein product [Protopolystoma xenopodis]|uniref:Uncharacterized protein n=1 Tax=Protopolystoma xenopodis TaxID=117903 RepID=A0A3S5FH66_9PLAT|nr:unnamed protein product [Protopolystoma xenopodis]